MEAATALTFLCLVVPIVIATEPIEAIVVIVAIAASCDSCTITHPPSASLVAHSPPIRHVRSTLQTGHPHVTIARFRLGRGERVHV